MSQNVKTLQGVAIANVKTVQGVAIANVKTIQGVDNTSGGGGPTLIASDDFDAYSDGSTLEGQSGWSQVLGSIDIRKPASDGSFYGSGTQNMYRSTATYSGDQRCEITCELLTPGSFTFICAGVRCQSGADTRYWFQTDGTNWYLVKRNAGSQAVITNSTHSITSGAKIALEASGSGSATRLTVQIDTGGGWANLSGAVSIDPGGTYIDGGTPGVGTDAAASTSARGDDFFGYDL